MSPRLIATIYDNATGTRYGPSLGNADAVPAEVARHHLDPDLWADGSVPDTSDTPAAVPAPADTPADPYEGVPTYTEAFETHRAENAVDVSDMTRDDLRALMDVHGLDWVHRDNKQQLIERLRIAGVAK